MEDVALVIRRFSAHEFAVRWLYASDPEFREACEHYATASCALRRLAADEGKAGEYQQLVKELEDEILAFLDHAGPNAQRT